jgi:hypothetical protein
LFTVITSTPGQDDIQQYINKLGNTFPDLKILLTGYQVIGQGLDLPKNTEVVSNVRQLMEFAED